MLEIEEARRSEGRPSGNRCWHQDLETPTAWPDHGKIRNASGWSDSRCLIFTAQTRFLQWRPNNSENTDLF